MRRKAYSLRCENPPCPPSLLVRKKVVNVKPVTVSVVNTYKPIDCFKMRFDNLNKFPTGYMTGFVTVGTVEYANTVKGVKRKRNTWSMN